MDSEPRWLDIEDELFPQILMMKQVLFENSFSGSLVEFYTEIKYNSFKRQIDLTPVIFKYFVQNSHCFDQQPSKRVTYEILIRDNNEEKLHLVGFFPNDDTYMLGEQFLSEEILYFIIKKQDKLNEEFGNLYVKETQKVGAGQEMKEAFGDFAEKPKFGSVEEVQKQEEELQENSKAKPNKRRTIEEVLKIIAEWRKLIMIKKLSSSEASDKVGMSKRSLQDYFTIIKLAQKYGFDFQSKMKNAFSQLRNFVKQIKQSYQSKPAPKVQILQKFKNTKK